MDPSSSGDWSFERGGFSHERADAPSVRRIGAFVFISFGQGRDAVMLRLAHDSVFSHSFGATAPFRLGVEEELFLVDPQSYAIARCTDTVVARRPTRASAGALAGEMCDGVVELATPVCDSADQAVEVLAGLREDVLAGGAAALMGVGVHPSTAFGDVRHRPGP